MNNKTIIDDEMCGAAHLSFNHTGLLIDIWSQHKGSTLVKSSDAPCFLVGNDDYRALISLNPDNDSIEIFETIPISQLDNIKQAYLYIDRNRNLFLNHWYDVANKFGDINLIQALCNHGDYI